MCQYIELLRLQFNCDMLCLSISILTLALRLMSDDHMMKLNIVVVIIRQYFKERGIYVIKIINIPASEERRPYDETK